MKETKIDPSIHVMLIAEVDAAVKTPVRAIRLSYTMMMMMMYCVRYVYGLENRKKGKGVVSEPQTREMVGLKDGRGRGKNSVS